MALVVAPDEHAEVQRGRVDRDVAHLGAVQMDAVFLRAVDGVVVIRIAQAEAVALDTVRIKTAIFEMAGT